MKRKARIKIGIVMALVCVMCFSDWSFAAEEKIFNVAEILNLITSILARGWVIFAKLAGEFLTNKWVYGEIIGLDSLLWQYRVLIKNIANFGLGFYFIYTIFSAIIGKDDIIKRIKGNLTYLLLAGIGIQASWFLTAAMIDVSTITLSMAGSLPSYILSKNETTKASIKNALSSFVDQNFKVTSGMEYRLFPTNGNGSFIESVSVPIQSDISKEEFLDMLVPNPDSISGPLYYMGFSILNTNLLNPNNQSSGKAVKASILNTIIQGGTTIIYAIEMGMLCVLALMRIIYLWMFIVLSPLVILLRCISNADKNVGEKIGGEKGFLGALTKHINLKSFFINIFKPTIIVLGIGVAMIFATLMSGVINKNGDKSIDEELAGVHIVSKKDGGNETYTTVINSNIFSYAISHAGKGLLDFIMSIITVILVYMIIKVAASLGGGKDFVSEKFSKIHKGVEDTMTSLPIIPVPGYNDKGEPTTRYLSAGKAFGLGGTTSLLEDKITNYTKKIDTYEEDKKFIRRELFGDKDAAGYLSEAEKREIKNVMDDKQYSGLIKLQQAKKVIPKTDEGQGMTLNLATASNEGFWIGQFEKWLNEVSEAELEDSEPWKTMKKTWDKLKEHKSLGTLFTDRVNGHKFVKAYVDLFGLDSSITTWNDLKDADISKKKKNTSEQK